MSYVYDYSYMCQGVIKVCFEVEGNGKGLQEKADMFGCGL